MNRKSPSAWTCLIGYWRPPAFHLASRSDCLDVWAVICRICPRPARSSLFILATSSRNRGLGRICAVGVARQSKGLEHPRGPVSDLSCPDHLDGLGRVLGCPQALT